MKSIPVLLYHSVDRECSASYRRWMVSIDRFDEHMRWLAEADYVSLTVSELAAAIRNAMPLPERLVLITFDDGLADFRHGALPILDRYGLSATLYVVAGRVGQTATWLDDLGEGDRAMLTWSQLRDLASHHVEIGAHTLTHPQLDVLPIATMRDEIEGSKALLEDALGVAIQSFAYPHGYASATTRKLVAEAGFSSACRVRHALSADVEDPFCISRIIVTEDMGRQAFMDAVRGVDLPVAPPPDRLLSDGWRMVRRVEHAFRYR